MVRTSGLRLFRMLVDEARFYLNTKNLFRVFKHRNSKIPILLYYNMVEIFTPDWNEEDHKKCQRYDEAVKNGTVTYRTIKIN